MAHTSHLITTRSIDNYLGDRKVFEGYPAIIKTNVVTIVKVRDDRLVDIKDQSGNLLTGYGSSAVLPIIR